MHQDLNTDYNSIFASDSNVAANCMTVPTIEHLSKTFDKHSESLNIYLSAAFRYLEKILRRESQDISGYCVCAW
eukprot:g41997.t1